MSDNIERLLNDLKESFEREIRDLKEHVDDGFDRIEARLDRQGGWLRSGQTNLVRLNTWSEDIDQLVTSRDKRLDKLEARIRKLENGS